MEEKNVVFDAARPITPQLRSGGVVKPVKVRFPSDAEWMERQRRRKVIIKHLGRGVSETTVPNGEDVDAALLAKIRAESDGEVDPFEAVRIVEQLSLAEVEDVVPEGGAFRVQLRVLGGTTSHLLSAPSAKDAIEYRRGFARVLDLPYNKQEITINLASAASLYQRLMSATEGYAGEVPIIHQAVVVKAAIDAADAAVDGADGGNFQ
ncbi:MAG: hypothetical protein IT165_06170 [Bryobacterales bacterium]|nr:hypothetical protein [Bryobacterales bacterium]